MVMQPLPIIIFRNIITFLSPLQFLIYIFALKIAIRVLQENKK